MLTLRTLLPFDSDYLRSIEVDVPSECESELSAQR
jgi:hypothetical protein